MFDFDLTENDMAELDEEIREACKITIRTLEIFYEELEKSKLPDSVKTAILVSQEKKKKMFKFVKERIYYGKKSKTTSLGIFR